MDLAFARAQMGVSLAFHIVFAVIGIGMPALMVTAEALWLRTRDATYLELTRRWARGTAVLAPAAALVFGLAYTGVPRIFDGLTSWWGIPLLVITAGCGAGALAGLWARRFRWARVAAVAAVTLILLGWGLAQHPYLVVPDVTVHAAKSAASTLRLLVWTLAAGALLLFPSFLCLYWVFKGQRQTRRAGRG